MNPFNSYVCFDICSGIERVSSRGHRAQMQFPQIFCHLCDKQVMVALCEEKLKNFLILRPVSFNYRRLVR